MALDALAVHGSAALHGVVLAALGDKVVSRQYEHLGFDGVTINKGDDESLVHQASVALRLAQLRRRSSRVPR